MFELYTISVGSKHNSENPTDGSGNERSGVIGSVVQQIQNGSIPIATGTTLFLRAIKGRRKQNHTAVRLLAATGLVAIGLRQRQRHNRPISEDDSGAHHSGTGTHEQRADSHRTENPRGTASEPEVEQDIDAEDDPIQFTHHQNEETESVLADDESSGDPRIDDDASEVDLSTASLADEASEAAGPSSVQSQPTQADELEPQESDEADTSDQQTEDSQQEKKWSDSDEPEEE